MAKKDEPTSNAEPMTYERVRLPRRDDVTTAAPEEARAVEEIETEPAPKKK